MPSRQLAFLLAVTAASLALHLSHRRHHFQEVDSATVYVWATHFPDWALFYTGNEFAYTAGAEATAAREALVRRAAAADLPYPLRCAAGLAWSSTYPPGVGLAYGLVTAPGDDIEAFLANASALTLTLFHVGVLVLFVLCRRLAGPFIALCVSLLYLFSISHYSYGLHLGSPGWASLTGMIWLERVFAAPPERRLARCLWLTGVLLWWNYLLVLFALAGAAAFAPALGWRAPGLKRRLLVAAVAGLFALGSFGVLWALFGQAGMSNRGTFENTADLSEAARYLAVNWFAWYPHSRSIDRVIMVFGCLALGLMPLASARALLPRAPWAVAAAVTAPLFLGAIAYGPDAYRLAYWRLAGGAAFALAVAVALPRRGAGDREWGRFALALLFLVSFLVAISFLGLMPSRHWLFASPLVFGWVAVLFKPGERFAERLGARGWALPVAMAALGFFCVIVRQGDTRRIEIPREMTDGVTLVLDVPSSRMTVFPQYWHPLTTFDTSPTVMHELAGRGLKPVRSPQEWRAAGGRLLVVCQHPYELGHMRHCPGWELNDPARTRVVAEWAETHRVWFTAREPVMLNFNRPNALFLLLVEPIPAAPPAR